MIVTSPGSRVVPRFGIIASPVLWIVFTLDDTPPACLRPLLGHDLICQETNAIAFWLYMALLAAVLLYAAYLLVRTFRKDDPKVLDLEMVLLRRWSKGVLRKTSGKLVFTPRSLWAAWIIAALWVLPLLRLAILHKTLYPSEFELEFLATLILGSVMVWLPVRWFSESLLLTKEGFQYRNLLQWGGILPWNTFLHIELCGDDERSSLAIRLHPIGFRPDIIISRNTIRSKERFKLACAFIVNRAIANGVPIRIPVLGIESWIEACQS
ncbi:MAG: hypothetical protein H7839_01730 [Magnetococcus sp. YQC-5]